MDAQDAQFGVAYVLKSVAEDVRAIRNDMQAYALKTETAYLTAKIEELVPRREFDEVRKNMDEIRARLDDMPTSEDLTEIKNEVRESYDKGPIAPWVIPTAAFVLSAITATVEIFDKLHR